MKLRPYQDDAVSGLRKSFASGKKNVVAVMPTGGGKSACIGFMAAGIVSGGKRVLILAHRTRLVSQLAETLTLFDVCVSRFGGSRRIRFPCMLGMVQTLRRRLPKTDGEDQYRPDYIIVDESHHALSPEYQAVINRWPNARIIGVTATPARTEGKGLGELFDDMVVGPTMRWLIDNGFLAEYRYFAIPSHINMADIKRDKKTGDYNEAYAAKAVRTAHVVGDAIHHYRAYADGKTGIVFCTGIDHAKEVAQQFCDAGIKSAAIDGTMLDDEQERLMKALETGEITLLMSADLIGEGVDVPSIGVVILLRPTQSIVVFLQQVGRVLRIKPDGSMAIILDHVGNSAVHGMPCDPREWSLESAPKKEVDIKTCGRCNRVFSAGSAKDQAIRECSDDECPIKTFIPKPRPETVTEVIDETLVEVHNPWEWAGGIDPVRASGPEYEALIAKANTEEKLKQIQRARGYNARWVGHLMVQKGLKNPERNFSKWSKRK